MHRNRIRRNVHRSKCIKQAIGALYKQKIINIETEGIRLINKGGSLKTLWN
ncbi:hypothetical protein [Parabacteroides massiliensis]|uniref:hypothetical protein n=1 Tax=Parabacteroides massiliensis TaxID=1750560 RepID=UPI001428B014